MHYEAPRFERERETLRAMILMYCQDRHPGQAVLCPDCQAVQEYALSRLECCTLGEDKPKCSDCPIHCYKPAMRDAIRDVMRHSGPRMAVKHPILALNHLMDGLFHNPEKAGR